VRRVGDSLVTTVYDLLLAQYGVGRDGLPGDWPTAYDDPTSPTPRRGRSRSPASRPRRPRIAREFARNAEESRGRSMISWARAPTTGSTPTRSTGRSSTLTTLTGCQGVNGGGWAHYVGQEKVRPITGYSRSRTRWTGRGRRGR
jgi:nitrate reductase alpha subunit